MPAESFFGKYDIRGKFPEDLDQEDAYRLGRAIARWKNPEQVLVGRDGRKESRKTKESLVEGLLDAGVNVLDEGKVPTPVIYWGCVNQEVDLGLSVTASHNPPGYTGVKICDSNGEALGWDNGLKQLAEHFNQSKNTEKERGERKNSEVVEDYLEAVKHEFSDLEETDVTVDYGNGVVGPTAERIFQKLGIRTTPLNKEVDGSFPNHLPDPGSKEAREKVRNRLEQDEIGIIFDGDGDRAGFVHPEKGFLDPDTVLSVFAIQILSDSSGKVLTDVRSSKATQQAIQMENGESLQLQVGHNYFSEKIVEDREVLLGGEASGHYYFPGIGFPFDDGLVAALLMLRIVQNRNLESLIDSLPEYPSSPEYRLDCPEERKEKVVQALKDRYSDSIISEADGIKFEMEGAEVLVRPSNTEPKMSVKVEAETEDSLNSAVNQVKEEVTELAQE